MEHPVVLIWEPNSPENRFGHAAIRTKNYHISLWPDGNYKDLEPLKNEKGGVTGSLVFHQNYDKFLEEGREPTQFVINYVSMDQIEKLYEKFLNYNDIRPDKVSLKKGEEYCKRGEKPEMVLRKSLYSFYGCFYESEGGGLFPKKKFKFREFYTVQQSCTTFCMNFLLNCGAYDHSEIFEKLIEENIIWHESLFDIDINTEPLKANLMVPNVFGEIVNIFKYGIITVPFFKTILEKEFKYEPELSCLIA
jgi:hypothetical protein